jgi:Caspase domain
MRQGALIAFLVVLMLSIIVRPAVADKRVALVIGNGRYIHANQLPNPPNDANAVANSLGAMGFDVTQGVDLDRERMEQLLRDFLHKADAAQVALLFYAGHGLQVDGRNYLIPVDVKIETASDLNFGTIDLDKILASLDDPARANIIILDACRDNPMARSFAAHARSASVGAGLAAYTALGTGTLIAYSTAPGKVAEDGSNAHSPFTASLLRYIAAPGIEVRQMLTRVRAEVAKATNEKQVPWDNSSLRGDVYLASAPKSDEPSLGVVPPPVTLVPGAHVPAHIIITTPADTTLPKRIIPSVKRDKQLSPDHAKVTKHEEMDSTGKRRATSGSGWVVYDKHPGMPCRAAKFVGPMGKPVLMCKS